MAGAAVERKRTDPSQTTPTSRDEARLPLSAV